MTHPEMTSRSPEQEPDVDEDWRLLKALIIGVPSSLVIWLLIWRAVSWLLA